MKNEAAIGELQVPSRDLTEPMLERIAAALPAYIAGSRWYRSKSKDIESVLIEDVCPIPHSIFYVFVIRLQHSSGTGDLYILPLSINGQHSGTEYAGELIADLGEFGVVGNALSDPEFRTTLLETIACERRLPGRNGQVAASRTSALHEPCDRNVLSQVESFVSRAEQSNTSVVYKNKYILKLFRKLEGGVNPDLEIGRFLTERGFKYTPAVLGGLEYRTEGGVTGSQVGVLQQFVPNRGDAWKYTLETLEGFFARALRSDNKVPAHVDGHLLDFSERKSDATIEFLAGSYLRSAELLGQRTAQMHAALTDIHAGPDFVPEPFTAADSEILHRDTAAQADLAFELLKKKSSSLTGETARAADELLKKEAKVGELLENIRGRSFNTVRIRHHGDYHLGQVLYTGDDFAIIDFEGEPARPLEDRRAKSLALRDVAGMVRSFQYAAYAALFGEVSGIPTSPESMRAIEAWGDAWNAAVSSAYLRGYFAEAREAPFVPTDREQRRALLDVFLLQKAFYEVAYELNNRPDWLRIPLRGILSLMA